MPSKLLLDIRGGRESLGLDFVAVYEDYIVSHLYFQSKEILASNVLDIYFAEYLADYGPSIIIEHSNAENGQLTLTPLPERTFPGVANAFQNLLKDGWGNILAKRAYPDTVKWLTAHNAMFAMLACGNHMIYGFRYPHPDFSQMQRKALGKTWGMTDKASCIQYLSGCMNGSSTVDKWRNGGKVRHRKLKGLVEKIDATGGERCLWAHDYQRVIIMAALGYSAEWLTFDEAVQWGVVAGRKLQSLFESWLEFIDAYLPGLCYFYDIDPTARALLIEQRLSIFNDRHQLNENPWELSWNTPLECTWTSRAPFLNPEGAKLPKRFKMLNELKDGNHSNLISVFLTPLEKLVAYIEEGGHSVEEIEVMAHCVIHEAISLERICSRVQADIARRSFNDTVARILKHFQTGINANDLLALHES
ncbi:MAG: DUF1266 domain-containing protein [Clostridiales bacterium]|nr:DUF1266 domain-containing protein [Clostridiales bacterium]